MFSFISKTGTPSCNYFNIFIYHFTGNADTSMLLIGGLGKDHEILRRRIENGAKELWFFLQSELKKFKNLEGNELQRRIDEFLSDLGHQERYQYFGAIAFLLHKRSQND